MNSIKSRDEMNDDISSLLVLELELEFPPKIPPNFRGNPMKINIIKVVLPNRYL